MKAPGKACPIVIQQRDKKRYVLAFIHPTAGMQFVKGTIEANEDPLDGAIRELKEESGLDANVPLIPLGKTNIGENAEPWHFFKYLSSGLPEYWSHQTYDDFGHTFAFFWHPLDDPLDRDWHPIFHEAFAFFAPLCMSD